LATCGLEVANSRAFWAQPHAATAPAEQAFREYWFGARSLARTRVLLANMRARFAAFPAALGALHLWPHMQPASRTLICHWHLQLTDPLYRRFTATFLPERWAGRPEITRPLAVQWVSEQAAGRWSLSTRILLASKLLSAAHAAGFVRARRHARPLATPAVPAEALEYLLYLLRETTFEGTLLHNPYLLSVGLDGPALISRLRALPGLQFRAQGDLIDYGWRYASLSAWAQATLVAPVGTPSVAPCSAAGAP
jgi:hypothetical protein